MPSAPSGTQEGPGDCPVTRRSSIKLQTAWSSFVISKEMTVTFNAESTPCDLESPVPAPLQARPHTGSYVSRSVFPYLSLSESRPWVRWFPVATNIKVGYIENNKGPLPTTRAWRHLNGPFSRHLVGLAVVFHTVSYHPEFCSYRQDVQCSTPRVPEPAPGPTHALCLLWDVGDIAAALHVSISLSAGRASVWNQSEHAGTHCVVWVSYYAFSSFTTELTEVSFIDVSIISIKKSPLCLIPWPEFPVLNPQL